MEHDPHATLTAARANSLETVERLRNALAPIMTSHQDVEVLAFGSLARGDFTSGSDVDWAVVVDGQVTQAVRQLPKKIADKLEALGFSNPEDVSEFGKLSSSLEIIGSIASKQDARLSLSRRMLLLFESASLTDGEVRSRMIEEVLNSYRAEETLSNASHFAVPRYLLNDTDLFWRLMCTDYSGQTRAREGKHWGLRSIKLNFSRKLLAFSAILRCLECHVHLSQDRKKVSPRNQLDEIYDRLRTTLSYSPVETLEKLLPPAVVGPIKASYGKFLHSIDDVNVRSELSALKWEDSEECKTLQELWALTRDFHDSLADVLLDQEYSQITRGCLIP